LGRGGMGEVWRAHDTATNNELSRSNCCRRSWLPTVKNPARRPLQPLP
jgi:hypothetical protein